MSHTIHKPLRARAWALVAAVLLAFGVAVTTASPAHAHDELIASDPATGSTVDTLPAQLTLTFSAEIADDDGASAVEVTDAAGTSLTDGAPTVQDNVLTQSLTGSASGAVTVLWKVVSSDGHPISGEFAFTVAGAPAPTSTATTAPTPTETSAPSPTAAPTPTVTGEPAGADDSSALPWVIAGVLALALIAAIVYLAVSRSRREKALAEGSSRAGGATSGPGSTPPADH